MNERIIFFFDSPAHFLYTQRTGPILYGRPDSYSRVQGCSKKKEEMILE